MFKRFLLVAMACMMALPFVTASQTQAATATDSAEIVLHKRIYDVNGNDGSQFENDGLLKDASDSLLSQTTGINDVHFAVYDATELLQKALESGQTADKFVQSYTALDLTAAKQIAADMTLAGDGNDGTGRVTTKFDQTLNEDGIGRITVPQRKDGQVAAYYIIETGSSNTSASVDLSTAAPMMLVMNVRHPETNDVLDTLHIYPKNDAYARDAWFFKFGVTADGDKVRLPDVDYVLSKTSETGEQLYLGKYTANQVMLNWYTSTNPATDERLATFTSDSDGLVATPGLFLQGGTYAFTETATVDGYLIDDTPVTVEVPDRMYDNANVYQPVLVNGYALAQSETEILPADVIETGMPRVYNYAKEYPGDPADPEEDTHVKLPDTGGSVSTPVKTATKQSSGIIPQLGNGWSLALIIIGFVLMAWVTLWWRMKEKQR